jgi:hypothetical protein
MEQGRRRRPSRGLSEKQERCMFRRRRSRDILGTCRSGADDDLRSAPGEKDAATDRAGDRSVPVDGQSGAVSQC